MSKTPQQSNKFKQFRGACGLIILAIFIYLLNAVPQDDDTKVVCSVLAGSAMIYCLYWIGDSNAKQDLEFKKLILPATILVLVLYWVGSTATPRSNFVILGCVTVFIVSSLYHLENKIHQDILPLQQKLKNAISKSEYSYQLRMEIAPNWDAILTRLFQDKHLLKALREEHLKHHNNNDWLLSKTFKFVQYYSSITDLSITWSDYETKFVTDISVQRDLFPGRSIFAEKLSEVLLTACYWNQSFEKEPQFTISPFGIGFEGELGNSLWLSKIPFRAIVTLITDIGKHFPDDPMFAIKRFPNDVQQKLDQASVTYTPMAPHHIEIKDEEHYWQEELNLSNPIFKELIEKKGLRLANHQALSHIFTTEFMRIGIKWENFKSTKQDLEDGF